MQIFEEDLKSIMELAKKMETDGITFYLRAGETVKSPMGKLMFQSFVKDEKNHLRVLDSITHEMFSQSLDEAFPGDPSTRLKTVFEKNRALLDERIKAGTGDVEALEIAMRMEDESFRLYHDAGGRSKNEAARALFDRLASEEKRHYDMLENSLVYLTDTGNWFIYEEHGIMDGG